MEEPKPKPKRKSNRLASWDYSRSAGYFITFCTSGRIPTLGAVDAGCDALGANAKLKPSALGKACAAAIERASTERKGLMVEGWAVMPNHVHLLVALEGVFRYRQSQTCRSQQRIPRLVSEIKSAVTWEARSRGVSGPVWQRGYHDHIIRSEREHERIAEYIRDNPLKWALDRYYVE